MGPSSVQGAFMYLELYQAGIQDIDMIFPESKFSKCPILTILIMPVLSLTILVLSYFVLIIIESQNRN